MGKVRKLRNKLIDNQLTLNSKNLDELLSLQTRINNKLKSLSAPIPKKRGQLNPENELAPVLKGLMNIRLGKPTGKAIRILVDSGAKYAVMDKKLCGKLRIKQSPKTHYKAPDKGTVQASST